MSPERTPNVDLSLFAQVYGIFFKIDLENKNLLQI